MSPQRRVIVIASSWNSLGHERTRSRILEWIFIVIVVGNQRWLVPDFHLFRTEHLSPFSGGARVGTLRVRESLRGVERAGVVARCALCIGDWLATGF